VPILGVIENMSFLDLPDERGWISSVPAAERVGRATDSPFLGKIPIVPAVREGGDNGMPIVVSQPESPAAVALRRIAEGLAAQISVAALSSKNELPINIVE